MTSQTFKCFFCLRPIYSDSDALHIVEEKKNGCVIAVTACSYFWESCSRQAAFWAAGLCLAWLSQPWVLYSTQSVPWLWPSRKLWGVSPRSSRVAPGTKRNQSRCSFKAPETVQSACFNNCNSTFTGLLLTFVVSMCCTVVAEESVQHGFLWTSRLDGLLLHQPQETPSFVRPGQRSHLLWEPRASNPTSTTGSVILTKPRWNNRNQR